MTSNKYIEKIIKDDACSIHTAELLTKALHKEGKLHLDLAVRFRPLYGDFDIMPQSWLDGDFTQKIPDYFAKPTTDPRSISLNAETASVKYAEYKRGKQRCIK